MPSKDGRNNLVGAVAGLVAANGRSFRHGQGLGDLSRCLGEARYEVLLRLAHWLQDLEVDLAVGVGAEDPYGRGGLSVSGAHYRAGSDRGGIGRVGKSRPAVAVVVLSVQVGGKFDPRHRTMVGSVVCREGGR